MIIVLVQGETATWVKLSWTFLLIKKLDKAPISTLSWIRTSYHLTGISSYRRKHFNAHCIKVLRKYKPETISTLHLLLETLIFVCINFTLKHDNFPVVYFFFFAKSLYLVIMRVAEFTFGIKLTIKTTHVDQHARHPWVEICILMHITFTMPY